MTSIPLPLAALSDPFAERLATDGQKLGRRELGTIQLNLGKMCNLACHHCHVEAGPKRTEMMSWETFERVIAWVDQHRDELGIRVVDMTGGAPEMNPHFCQMVEVSKSLGLHVLDRCNLTIMLEPGHEDLIGFLAQHHVEIVASLPCYLEENVDAQRGHGVYNDSILVLRRLNEAGYARDPHLRLDLVYNPVGYGLPPEQSGLEQAYKQQLQERFGIVFDRLWTITNMPIKRFANALHRDGMYEQYLARLRDAHNSKNVPAVMCRSLVSVGWEGSVYDCDFNQMLQMSLAHHSKDGTFSPFGPGDDEHVVERQSRKIWEFTPNQLVGRPIRTGGHCFGCTAGSGSSCSGSLS